MSVPDHANMYKFVARSILNPCFFNMALVASFYTIYSFEKTICKIWEQFVGRFSKITFARSNTNVGVDLVKNQCTKSFKRCSARFCAGHLSSSRTKYLTQLLMGLILITIMHYKIVQKRLIISCSTPTGVPRHPHIPVVQ